MVWYGILNDDILKVRMNSLFNSSLQVFKRSHIILFRLTKDRYLYAKGINLHNMAIQENFEVNIRTIKEKLPQSSQIDIDEDFCLMDIQYDERQENFGYPCRLDGNVMLFCINGSIRLSVNLNDYEIKEGELIICTDGDIVKVSRPEISGAERWHFVMLAMSHRFASDLRIDFKRILNEGIIPLNTPVIRLNETVREILGDHLKLIAKIASCKGSTRTHD